MSSQQYWRDDFLSREKQISYSSLEISDKQVSIESNNLEVLHIKTLPKFKICLDEELQPVVFEIPCSDTKHHTNTKFLALYGYRIFHQRMNKEEMRTISSCTKTEC